jgi:hypothetical protein
VKKHIQYSIWSVQSEISFDRVFEAVGIKTEKIHKGRSCVGVGALATREIYTFREFNGNLIIDYLTLLNNTLLISPSGSTAVGSLQLGATKRLLHTEVQHDFLRACGDGIGLNFT